MSTQPLALVTGASRRLGRLFAETLARRGYAIALHYHCGENEAAAAAKAIGEAAPVFPVKADLTDPAQVQALFRQIDGFQHPLRVLVNSAAVMPRGDLRSLPLEEWQSTLALNLTAPFLLGQQAALRMQAGGLIVNITDIGAKKTWVGFPAYTVSKAALESLTRLMARSFAPGIRVNAIAPGLALKAEDMPDEDWNRLVGRLPLPRSARPQELAAALEFLLENEYITGQSIAIDGGYSLL